MWQIRKEKINFVVNTAALLIREPLNNMKYSDICHIIRVNYLGMVHVALESFPYLKESRGNLLLYTSTSYTRGRGGNKVNKDPVG